MNRCLKERALLRVSMHEGTAAEQAHLRFCADCAEHYDLLLEDLEAIARALETPPPRVFHIRNVSPRRGQWMAAAIAVAVLAVLILDIAWLQRSSPVQVAAHTSSASSFAADLSAALFPTTDTSGMLQLAAEAPYLEAALEIGQPCTQDRFFTGECNDQLSPVLVEGD
jgi:hypothetical protein